METVESMNTKIIFENKDNDVCVKEQEDRGKTSTVPLADNDITDASRNSQNEMDCPDKFDESEMRFPEARLGICSICNLQFKNVEETIKDFQQALLCSLGHLICYRCVKSYSIKSDTKCVLCSITETQNIYSNLSRSSSTCSLPSKPIQSNMHSQYHGFNLIMNNADGNNFLTTKPVLDESTTDWDTDHEDLFEPNSFAQKSHLYETCCTNLEKEDLSMDAKGAKISSQMMAECSRRPIRCPRLDCAVNVAFSSLTNHFLFDHPEVPILNVEPNEKSTLIINFDGLISESSRCLSLLLVSGKFSCPAAKLFNGGQMHPRYKNRLPLPLLAARLSCEIMNVSSEDVKASGKDRAYGEVVIIWIAGLDIGNSTEGALRCSIEATDRIQGDSLRSVTYSGPINSLRTAQKPKEVFLGGDCVILHQGFINHITNEQENLNVNVIIH